MQMDWFDSHQRQQQQQQEQYRLDSFPSLINYNDPLDNLFNTELRDERSPSPTLILLNSTNAKRNFQVNDDVLLLSNAPSFESSSDKRFTRFTGDQKKMLEFHFSRGDYWPSRRIREKLAAVLNVPQRKVQIWFQNQRAKMKDTISTDSITPALSEEEEDRIFEQDLQFLSSLEQMKLKRRRRFREEEEEE
jgi:hypothetical protein